MQHDAFIGQVQARARLDSRGSAETATRATLETLAERIPADLAEDLAAQLPREISENILRITSQPGEEQGHRFDRDEFIARVKQRSHTDEPKAAHIARVVFEVLDEATTGGTMEKVRQSLPEDLRQLALAGSKG
ncbi:hypothetical protein JCM3263A_20650 [Thermobifida fusca]|jgi:uncharacterized protein (DUF2267 family)|uniref:DUF2267 domain-containing protein n=2 Tax=Thermobifida fusca TaxID=2021 RepID=A0A9P2WR41_THEFU|nr:MULTISPECIES: DUF2267 domain-containing protein [Thermobifida]AAZ55493.1 conserved hypothetical protein [Thermobifida fusca YX]EOR71446.1 hypothetical protein TM51_07641 [Thermobifida fusca TM51]MBO2528309.1 DUF2267 domain-containing protein [Thermobifida sp.]PPS91663.1 hypothetical protein BH05_13905 [Thermobifida fusca]PZN64821.1 MAG: DUF2267 domain-containing protein [Thermobifida fusca]